MDTLVFESLTAFGEEVVPHILGEEVPGSPGNPVVVRERRPPLGKLHDGTNVLSVVGGISVPCRAVVNLGHACLANGVHQIVVVSANVGVGEMVDN
jgi:hypothetical protein